METNSRKPLAASAINYSLIVGLILTIIFLLQNVLELYDNKVIGWISNLFFVAAIAYGIKRRRDLELGGNLSYGQGLGYGSMVGLFTGLFVGIISFVYLKFVDDSMTNFIIETQEQEFYNQGMSDAQIETSLSFMKKFFTPGGFAIIGTFTYLLFGFFVALIASAFIKKEAESFDDVD